MIIEKLSPNYGGLIKPEIIVLHHTAGANSLGWLTNRESGVSAHFLISRDGTTYQLVRSNMKAFHAGVSTYYGRENVNNFSIGIEHENWGRLSKDGLSYTGKKVENIYKAPDGSLWEAYSKEQLLESYMLCYRLIHELKIKDIVRHRDIAPGRKEDVGPAFPFSYFSELPSITLPLIDKLNNSNFLQNLSIYKISTT